MRKQTVAHQKRYENFDPYAHDVERWPRRLKAKLYLHRVEGEVDEVERRKPCRLIVQFVEVQSNAQRKIDSNPSVIGPKPGSVVGPVDVLRKHHAERDHLHHCEGSKVNPSTARDKGAKDEHVSNGSEEPTNVCIGRHLVRF